MTSEVLFTALVLAYGLERLAEMVVSKRHTAWAFSHGGVEFGRGHYPAMVALHTALLGGAVAEVWLLDRPFVPALGWPMLAVALASQALRWWCIATLGRQWNTRVIIVPELPLVRRGPYRLLRHPNYVAVVLEGAALPLVHSAWITAAVFTVLNAVLLRVRISVENQALATVQTQSATSA
jgi:methyltransferase